jgi:molybdopterin-guanine dinucleotide biosynthesis protein A
MTEACPEILGVLLAGGRSKRMGIDDKCLASLAGRPLLAHAIDRLRPQVSALILNANGDPARFRQFGLTVVPDTVAGFAGPLAGMLAGMLRARSHMPDIRRIATVATDTPFLPDDLVARLSTAFADGHEAAIACCRGQDYPVFGLFSVALADQLAAFLGASPNRAVKAWLDRLELVRIDFSPENEDATDPFFNVNTPADLAMAEALLRGNDERAPMR